MGIFHYVGISLSLDVWIKINQFIKKCLLRYRNVSEWEADLTSATQHSTAAAVNQTFHSPFTSTFQLLGDGQCRHEAPTLRTWSTEGILGAAIGRERRVRCSYMSEITLPPVSSPEYPRPLLLLCEWEYLWWTSASSFCITKKQVRGQARENKVRGVSAHSQTGEKCVTAAGHVCSSITILSLFSLIMSSDELSFTPLELKSHRRV